MAPMTNYVTFNLNGTVLKFRTVHKQWSPVTDKPMSVRYAWDGTIDVTYGPGMFHSWRGVIMADVTPLAGWGSVSDVRNLIALLKSVPFVDHYGNSYTVHIQPIGEERSYSSKWDNASNMILFPVQLYAEA
jgi:hypothetical protein